MRWDLRFTSAEFVGLSHAGPTATFRISSIFADITAADITVADVTAANAAFADITIADVTLIDITL